jgi:hypothetical protein
MVRHEATRGVVPRGPLEVRRPAADPGLECSMEREGHASVDTPPCRNSSNGGMLSFRPCREREGPIILSGSFYIKTGRVGSKAQCGGGRSGTGGSVAK